MGRRKHPNIEQRFWEKVDKSGDCWVWTAAKRGNGYGAFKIDRKMHQAHRLAYEYTFGKIPEGLFACHKCDNRICVNPHHIFLGTNSDNMKDAWNKGRLVKIRNNDHFRGKINVNASLTREKVLYLKSLLTNKGTKTVKQIAKEEGIKYSTMLAVSSGRYYKSVTL